MEFKSKKFNSKISEDVSRDIRISNIESEEKVKEEVRRRYELQPLSIEEKIFSCHRNFSKC